MIEAQDGVQLDLEKKKIGQHPAAEACLEFRRSCLTRLMAAVKGHKETVLTKRSMVQVLHVFKDIFNKN